MYNASTSANFSFEIPACILNTEWVNKSDHEKTSQWIFIIVPMDMNSILTLFFDEQ